MDELFIDVNNYKVVKMVYEILFDLLLVHQNKGRVFTVLLGSLVDKVEAEIG